MWTEEGDLGPVRWSAGLKIEVLDRTAILWNKILEPVKGAKRLQSNSDFNLAK